MQRLLIGNYSCLVKIHNRVKGGRQGPLDSYSRSNGWLNLKVEDIIRAQCRRECRTAVARGKINGDFKLLAGFQKVIAVVIADGSFAPSNIVQVL